MATETHSDNSQGEILSAIKSLRLELRNNREEYLALSDRADRLFSTLEAKLDGDAIFATKKAKLRIDPPKFNGDDPLGWIYKVQSYFDYFETSEKDRLRLVGLLFEHRASNWLLHQHDNNLVTTWPEFLEAVKRRFDPPCALRVTGTISGIYVETIISGNSTHNFIQPEIVKKCWQQVTPINPFRVCVGNGSIFVCKEKCNNVKFTLEGHEVVVDLFVLPIHAPKVVLGAPWLKTLGEIYRSYDNYAMEFTHKDKVVTLRGHWEKGQHIFYNAIRE